MVLAYGSMISTLNGVKGLVGWSSIIAFIAESKFAISLSSSDVGNTLWRLISLVYFGNRFLVDLRGQGVSSYDSICFGIIPSFSGAAPGCSSTDKASGSRISSYLSNGISWSL